MSDTAAKTTKTSKPRTPKEPKMAKAPKAPKAPKSPKESKTEATADVTPKGKPTKKPVDPDFIIPIAHIKKYISKYRINKEINELIERVKKCQKEVTENGKSRDLSEELHEDVLKRIEDFKSTLSPAAKTSLDEKDQYQQAIHALSIFKHKFSGNAFAIVAYVLNLAAKEIVVHTLEKTVQEKKRSLVPKHIPWDVLKTQMLSGLYLNTNQVLKTLEEINNLVEESEDAEDVEEIEETTSSPEEGDEDETATSVDEKLSKYNLRHFLHKLCKHVINTDERFTKFKINGTFTETVNVILIDVMERYIKMIYILVNISNNKTINDKIFLAITKIMIEDNNNSVEADQDTLYQLIESKLANLKLNQKGSVDEANKNTNKQ